jgi:hypothetical protein
MDTIETLIEHLPTLLEQLKEGEVGRFKFANQFGELEIEYPSMEPEPPRTAGFVPVEAQAKTAAEAAQNEESSGDPYVKAFAGKPPRFSPPKG